jgi:hypothetical protein
MIRQASLLVLLTLAATLSVHVENIHYGYRNVYTS